MRGRYFRVSKFLRWNPDATKGSKWVKLSTKITQFGEDVRGLSDAAKLTLFVLFAAAPAQNNIFPNDEVALKVLLGIETIELDELLEMEFVDLVDEQQYFAGVEPLEVSEKRQQEAKVDKLREAWNEMARICGLKERTRVKYRSAIWKMILTRFKDAEWVVQYPQALELIPQLKMLTGEKKIGESQWRANLDWFIKPPSVDSILNGKYGSPLPAEGVFGGEDESVI